MKSDQARIDAREVIHVHADKKDSVKDVVSRAVAHVRENEPKTLRYDWYISDDGMTCVLFDSYADSDAALFHMKSLGPLLQELYELGTWEVEVYGNPSDALKQAIAISNPTYFGILSRFSR